MHNSTLFTKLRPNQDLYLVRYSKSPTPDFIIVTFKGVDTSKSVVEFTYKEDIKKRIKKFPIRKAEYRLFLDKLEMAKSLYDCFVRRNEQIIP